MDSGIRLLREPHGALLEPIKLIPRRLVEIPVEDHEALSRAWELIAALSAAFNATRSQKPGEYSVTEMTTLLSSAQPDLQLQYAAGAQHCSIAYVSLTEPRCNWQKVGMSMKRTPAIDGRI